MREGGRSGFLDAVGLNGASHWVAWGTCCRLSFKMRWHDPMVSVLGDLGGILCDPGCVWSFSQFFTFFYILQLTLFVWCVREGGRLGSPNAEGLHGAPYWDARGAFCRVLFNMPWCNSVVSVLGDLLGVLCDIGCIW